MMDQKTKDVLKELIETVIRQESTGHYHKDCLCRHCRDRRAALSSASAHLAASGADAKGEEADADEKPEPWRDGRRYYDPELGRDKHYWYEAHDVVTSAWRGAEIISSVYTVTDFAQAIERGDLVCVPDGPPDERSPGNPVSPAAEAEKPAAHLPKIGDVVHYAGMPEKTGTVFGLNSLGMVDVRWDEEGGHVYEWPTNLEPIAPASPAPAPAAVSAERVPENTFTDLREANAARHIEWWNGGEKMTQAFRGNELAGEAGEAVDEVLNYLVNGLKFAAAIGRSSNVIKKLERERMGQRGSRATKDDLAAELADARICLDLIAMDAGIDLDAATAAKFNETSEKYGLATRLVAPASRENSEARNG